MRIPDDIPDVSIKRPPAGQSQGGPQGREAKPRNP